MKTTQMKAFREIRVAIVEDDPYARDLMALLMWRDWRTRVVAEVGQPDEVPAVIEAEKPDLILFDADDLAKVERLVAVLNDTSHLTDGLKVLCIATRPDKTAIHRCLQKPFCGYLLRAEIAYALVWGVSLACKGKWVATPSVMAKSGPPPSGSVVLKDLPGYPGLTPQEA